MSNKKFSLHTTIQSKIDQHYLDFSISRVLPLVLLMIFGVLIGLVFQTGVGHPYDKIIHVAFYALLTLSIHTFFCCRLRISAVAAFTLGIFGEAIQAFLPHHHASMADAVANAIGVSLVIAAIALLRSEKRQAVRSEPIDLDFEAMGLEPVQSEVAARASASSEK
ncbi:MAG: antibiotic resistance protein VanZ [Rhodobacteraceae bacterium]|nr:antibiotic resistance protein VanZ [Paracoccaceae bacterium]